MKRSQVILGLLLSVSLVAQSASAKTRASSRKKKASVSAPAHRAPVAPPSANEVERPRISEPQNQDVSEIKQQYWSGMEDPSVGVVQNRIYSKSGKFELGVFGGVLLTDPFLSVKSAGAAVGYHFSEFWGLRVLGWKSFVSPSSAYVDFEATRGAIPLVNEPKSYYGAELAASLVYGKLSVLGKSIVYYDLHLVGGAGVTGTYTGHYFTPSVGLGQQIYLSRAVALALDYRLMAYQEDLEETVILATLGQKVRSRTNWTNSITLGFTFLLGSND